MNYLTAKEIKELCKITGPTLMHWRKEGKIKYKALSSKKILYDIDSLNTTDAKEDQKFNTKNVIYARVSTPGQKEDLDNQIELIKKYIISNGIKVDEIYSDIASGMNESRKDFNELLISIFKREIKTVYITFKDRLSRFGFEYFRTIFAYFGTSIEILDDKEETNKTYEQELTEDLISLIHSYSMKMHDNRKKKFKKIEEMLSEQSESL